MGLFGKFSDMKENRRLKRIEKAKKLVRNAKAIKDDRWAAISFFAEDIDDCETAVSGLLPRFDYSLEHGINDSREKELAFKGVVRFGDQVVDQVVAWLKTTTRIAWPIKIIKEVADEATVAESLKQVLNFGDVAFDQAAVDKNYDILCYLHEYPLGSYYKEIAHFLNDPDERVRFAAAEALIAQKDPEAKVFLEPFLKDDTSENRRIRSAVIQAFVEGKWKVEDSSAFPDGRINDDVSVDANGLLARRA